MENQLPHTAKAMVLAAGLGTRMLPLTRHTPKPLLKVAGCSILYRILDDLSEQGIGPMVVNIHHHPEAMRDALQPYVANDSLVISDETDGLLETGGGVQKALPLLDAKDFFVINSDVVWQNGTVPVMPRLRAYWQPEKMDALLLMVPTGQAYGYDGVGDFFMDFDATADVGGDVLAPLRFRDEATSAPFMFGAVQIINAELYDGMPIGAWSNREVFRKAASRGRLFGLVHDAGWVHVGTPDMLMHATQYIDNGWSWPAGVSRP